jgi:1-acyl-sn-glycerol-3-phosphate acyltransferase
MVRPNRILGFARALVGWSYLGVAAVIFALVMLLLWPSRRLRICAFNAYGRVACGVFAFVAGASLPRDVIRQMRARHPAIFVSNHTSFLDNFIASWAAPIGTVSIARAGTQWVPFFGNLYAMSGNVMVNRTDRRGAAAALRTLIDLVQRHGLSAMIWPEGGRSMDGRLKPFKRGFVHLAIATRLPVVPLVVTNAHRCWPKGSALTRSARVGVRVLPPISTEHWAAATIDQHVEEVWSVFAAALPDEQKPAANPTAEV